MSLRSILGAICLIFITSTAFAQEAGDSEGFSIQEVEGEYQLLWGYQPVLRNLSINLQGQPVDFDPALIEFQTDGSLASFARASGGVGGLMQMTGLFALSFKPKLRRSQPLEGGILQYISGNTGGRNCDVILAPKKGLAVKLTGCGMDLAAYQVGAPLELRFDLDKKPSITMTDAPERAEDQNDFAGLEAELKRRFADKDGNLPRTLQQLVEQPPRAPRHFHLANLAGVQPSAETQLINFRIGEGANFPAQDVFLFLNSSDQKRKLTADFKALGWDKIKMRRMAVQYPDGDCLGEMRGSLSATVPAEGWAVVLLRKPMPRGVLATSDGPFFALSRLWEWTGSGTAKSGERSFFAAYKGPGTTSDGGWMILSTSNGAREPYTLENVTDPDGNPFQFRYNPGDSWAWVEYPVNENESQTIHFHFGNAGPGGGKSGKKQP